MIKSRYLIFLILLLFFNPCFALPDDSLVKFSDLNFSNGTEEYNLKNSGLRTQGVDVIDLLLIPYNKKAAYSSNNAHRQINVCVAELKDKTEGQSNAKRVKFIYSYVHKRFLKLYQLKNSFADIFEKGEYNCVSATALYAIIFKQMGIPFQIVEAPQHVYLIAYPQNERLIIETTSPQNGYMQVSDGDVDKFTRHLYDSKLISKEEYQNSSSKALFDKYYYSNSGLELEKMPGVQYFNYALFHLDNKEYEEASQEIKKAYFLEQSERNKYLLKSILQYQVSNSQYADPKKVDDLLILCRYNNLKDKEISNEMIHLHFGKVINDQLIKNSDYQAFDVSFKKIYDAVEDTALKNEIAFDYHYELARLGMINLKNNDYELSHLSSAYHLNPRHANLQAIILACFLRQVDQSNEPGSVLATIQLFNSNFGFLNDNEQYRVVTGNCYLELAYQSAARQNMNKSESYLRDFENLYNQKGLKPNEHFVERAYSEAASYYYKRGDRQMAKRYLNTGLKYAPNNFGLKMRLNQVH